MDYLSFEKHSTKRSLSCCESVNKMRQYACVIQAETGQINSMQMKCNLLLDNFYRLKNNFDFLMNEMLPIKYLAENDSYRTKEHINEFFIFCQSLWKLGKVRFSEKGKKAKYITLVGYPLSDVISTAQIFVEEVLHHMTFTPSHSGCSAVLYSLSSQIKADLHEGSLGSADACFHQLTYLDLANPFLQKLCELIDKYLLLPDVNTPKQFEDFLILQISSDQNLTMIDNLEDMKPYKFLIDLLNGKLIDNDILDHNSDIKPVVEDDIHLKRSVVKRVVQWLLEQNKNSDVENISKDQSPTDFVDGSNIFNKNIKNVWDALITNSPSGLWYTKTPEANVLAPPGSRKSACTLMSGAVVPIQQRMSRRTRKSRAPNEPNPADDLQPIKLHALHTPLLLPLL